MSQPSTISLDRPTPKIATITFSNPPVNLVVGETVTRLHELVVELGGDRSPAWGRRDRATAPVRRSRPGPEDHLDQQRL